jgi:hypothetical protein
MQFDRSIERRDRWGILLCLTKATALRQPKVRAIMVLVWGCHEFSLTH